MDVDLCSFNASSRINGIISVRLCRADDRAFGAGKAAELVNSATAAAIAVSHPAAAEPAADTAPAVVPESEDSTRAAKNDNSSYDDSCTHDTVRTDLTIDSLDTDATHLMRLKQN